MTATPTTAFVALLVFSSVLGVGTPAQAEGSQEAEKLFNAASALLQQGKIAQACTKFDESNRLEAGVGVQLWLATCRERQGKIASAYNQYMAAGRFAATNKDPREKIAYKHASDLEAQLSKLVISVPPSSRVAGLEVTRDGTPVTTYSQPIIVDPGTYRVAASAPDYLPWEVTVDVGADGATSNVSVGPLVRAPKLSTPEVPKSEPFWTPFRAAGTLTAGVGLLSVGVGAGFAVIAQSSLDDSNANNHCDAASACDGAGLQLRSDAKSAALFSTAAFIAGGVFVAGGATMFLFGSPGKSRKPVALVPAVAPNFSGLAAVGVF